MNIRKIIKAALAYEKKRRSPLPHTHSAVFLLESIEGNPEMAAVLISEMINGKAEEDVLMERQGDIDYASEEGFKFRTAAECAAFKDGIEFAGDSRYEIVSVQRIDPDGGKNYMVVVRDRDDSGD